MQPALSHPKTHLDGLITGCENALDRGDIAEALRLSDRAVRLAPDSFHVRIMRGAALILGGQPQLALANFSAAVDMRRTSLGLGPDGEIGLAHAHLALGDRAAAAVQIAALVSRCSPLDFPGIAPAAATICRVLGAECPGWVSLGADLKLVGAARLSGYPADMDLVVADADGGAELLRVALRELLPIGDAMAKGDEFGPFELSLAATPGLRSVTVEIGGVALLGSPAAPPSGADIEGLVERSGRRVHGWAWLPGHPSTPLTIRLVGETGATFEVAADKPLVSRYAKMFPKFGPRPLGFTIDSNLDHLGPVAEIWGWLPSVDSGNRLTGSPISTAERRQPQTQLPPSLVPLSAEQRPVDVIVPIYGGLTDTRTCLESLIASRADSSDIFEIVAIDDGSGDPALASMLEALAADGRIALLTNPRNLGFPRTVNRGFALHPDRDVVILNSDTVVYGDWLSRLRAAAYAAPDIGTVTPFSNEATILSYPDKSGNNPAPSIAEGRALDALARASNPGLIVDIPTAVGFCMYIRRDCLSGTGAFDVTSFGRGYGEENDFCMRAAAGGWRHVAAANVYVPHKGGGSFGASARMLTNRNIGALNRLWPGYDRLIADFVRADPLAGARRELDIARLRRDRSTPAVLLITLGLGGGVAHNVRSRAEALADKGRMPFILAPAEGREGACILTRSADNGASNLIFQLPDELDGLCALLGECGIESMEIHHFLGLDPSVLAIPRRIGAPYDVVLHDYSWVCPRITLMNAVGRYCGMPTDIAVCDRCVATAGSALTEPISVSGLRRRSKRILAGAREVAAACDDVVARFRTVIPRAVYRVSPWEDEAFLPPALPSRPVLGRIRVAVLGAIGEQKGYRLLLNCARDAARRDLPLEFTVVGFTENDLALFKTGRVFVTGRYEEDEAVALIRAQQCHFAFMPSITPETWSYALSLAWRAGLYVLAFDFGAIAERIRATGYGRLLPFTSNARALNRALLDLLPATNTGDAVRIEIHTLIRDRGDVAFTLSNWAGFPGEGLWIEAFALTPIAGVAADEVEYRGVMASGFETRWLSGGVFCGMRGLGMPLVGFAVRLRGMAGRRYECRYEGAFSGGRVAGPQSDGADCRLPDGDAPLEAIYLEIIEKIGASVRMPVAL